MNSERLEKLKKMLEEAPDDPFLNYALAMEYIDEAPLKSWDIFSQLLIQFPDYLPTYYQAAQLAMTLGYHKNCISIFVEGIQQAQHQNETKALHELKAAYQNYLFDIQ